VGLIQDQAWSELMELLPDVDRITYLAGLGAD
jgi:hypothetical protein